MTTEEVLTRGEVQLKPQYENKFTPAVVSKIQEPNLEDYEVGPRDVLSVTVYGEEDLSLQDSIVSSDGFISLPLIGRVHVEGLTTIEIEKKLASLLSKGYLVNPQVTATVKSFQSKKVFILGAVEKPGVFPLQGNTKLLEIISASGGILYETAGKYLMVWRYKNKGDSEDDNVIKIGIDNLLKEGDMSLNIAIHNKDVVFVPQAEHVYIIGQVKAPGSYKLTKNNSTVLEAITMAGGFTPIAAPNKTRIIRVEDGIEKNILVKMEDIIEGERKKDVILQSGDIIVVPESLF